MARLTLGLFNKNDTPVTESLNVPDNNPPAKSETTTAVPSQNVSDTESLEKSRDVEKAVLNEKKLEETNHSTATSETNHNTAVRSETPEKAGDATLKKTTSRSLQRTTSVISAPGAEDGDEIIYPSGLKFALITLALCLSVFLVALDNTIIATAIPKITDHFNSLSDVGWYGSAYLLTTCALQLFFGKLYTFYPIKTVFLVSIVIFEVGSAVW